MSCSECRGYSVPYCPVCSDDNEIDIFPLVASIVDKIDSGEITHHDELVDLVHPFSKWHAESEADFDSLNDWIFEELKTNKSYQNLDKD